MLNMRKLITIIVLVLGVSACCAFASDVEDAAGEPSEGGNKGVFEGNFGESVWALVTFGVLLVALYFLAWKPLLAGLQARQDYIEKQISDAEKVRRQAEKYLAEYRAKLAGVEEEGKGIIAEHISKAEQEGKKVSAKTQKELEVMKFKAEADIVRQQAEAKSHFWVQAGDIVLRLGKQVLSRAMTAEDNQHLIDDAIKRLKMEEKEEASSATNN